MTQAEARAFVREYKATHPCVECGEQRPYYSMEFDHVRGDKLFNLGSVGWFHGQANGNERAQRAKPLALTLTLITQEIEKCDLLCVLCHRDRQYGHLV